ncbi:MAG: hypothetical protein QF903_13855 [Planctomycetota bacterium]|jgi:uncharacterized membrane protein|nr:hypothetical protein [Planctomycetota bacterium]MDP6762959.1 hypothetical protein [Planctomycetota bacterium]MDP6990550.1 hypothetical protein [Planctomycetota bacterium]
MSEHEKRGWLDEPRNVDRLFWGLAIVCALLVVVELVFGRHAEFSWEGWPGFYGAFGFAVFVAVVLIGKRLRRFLRREEDYYDR